MEEDTATPSIEAITVSNLTEPSEDSENSCSDVTSMLADALNHTSANSSVHDMIANVLNAIHEES